MKMIEFPAIQELVAETKQDAIIRFLRARFGVVPAELEQDIQRINDFATLNTMVERMDYCTNPEQVRELIDLAGEQSPPAG